MKLPARFRAAFAPPWRMLVLAVADRCDQRCVHCDIWRGPSRPSLTLEARLRVVDEALAAGVDQTGASLIVVDNSVDGGPIIAQERVPVLPGDTETSLHDRIKPVERRLLIQAVLDIANSHLDLKELAR
jgi:hypothetical protein